MSDDLDKEGSETNRELEQEIREGRKFSPEEALARMAGPGAMKGASPVSPVQQAETEIGTWLRDHLSDATGALRIVLERNLKGSELLLNNVERPLRALAEYCERILGSEQMLRDVVREADVQWGRMMDEPPFFEKEGSVPNAGDPYTMQSVRSSLSRMLAHLGPLV